ncbi:MAG: cobalt ABC transporter permease [Thermodesulfovibrionales bacterium]|jgi:CBS domain containing-hemolysin-like protein
MRGQKSGAGSRRFWKCFFLILLLFTLICSPAAVVSSSEKWTGVDESVVEKYAKEHGREARRPLIDTDQGDLLLFVFLLAGTIGGFAAGYYWRELLEPKTKEKE